MLIIRLDYTVLLAHPGSAGVVNQHIRWSTSNRKPNGWWWSIWWIRYTLDSILRIIASNHAANPPVYCSRLIWQIPWCTYRHRLCLYKKQGDYLSKHVSVDGLIHIHVYMSQSATVVTTYNFHMQVWMEKPLCTVQAIRARHNLRSSSWLSHRRP